MAPTGDGEDRTVTLFREYVRIETVQPRPDYDGAIKFLIRYAEELALPHTTHECVPGKPILVMTWEGSRAFNEPNIALRKCFCRASTTGTTRPGCTTTTSPV